MKTKRRTQVLVVGAGPSGLFTAFCLARRGIDVQIVDKYSRTALHSYALALHPQSLCLLDELELAGELIERAHRVERIAVYRGAERMGQLELNEVGGPFPFVLVLPQTWLEGILERRLEQLGVKVAWSHPLIHLDHARRTAVAFLARMRPDAPEGEEAIEETFRLHANFVVGADGYNSFTRRVLQIDFPVVGPSATYELFEFRAPMVRPDELTMVFGPSTVDGLWPLGEEHGRWSFQTEQTPRENPGPQGLRERILERAPWFGEAPQEIEWSTAITFERRLAERLGESRVRLVGDAARLTTPLGVQNMNVGLREAYGLAQRLATTLQNDDSPDVFETFDAERRSEWLQLLGMNGPPRVLDGAPEWAAELSERIVSCLPVAGAELERLLRGIGLELAPPRSP